MTINFICQYGIIRTMCYSKNIIYLAGGSKHTFRVSYGVNWDFSNLDGETYMISRGKSCFLR